MSENKATSTTILHTAILQTGRLQEMANFYRQGLKLGEPVEERDHLGFPLPNAYLGFDLVEEPPTPTGAVSLWFEVDDLQETFDKFVALGAGVKYPPTHKPWGARLAALYDPDGNVFGLTGRNETPA